MKDLSPVLSIHRLMADFPCRWGFCGGWAIDLFLARQTRLHKVVLLCKAKYTGEEDHQADFTNALPRLSERRRAWLVEAIATHYGAHAWVTQ